MGVIRAFSAVRRRGPWLAAVEAMASGRPLVSGTCASLREVVADAALTLDEPNEHERIAALPIEVLTDVGHAAAFARQRLGTRGTFFSRKIPE
jgi:hypothetical protein